MNTDSRNIHARILELLCNRYRQSVSIVPVDSLPHPGAYNFDPGGWELFSVRHRTRQELGAAEFVAVSKSTGEVRYLGHIGQ
jgi:hypothetical protein